MRLEHAYRQYAMGESSTFDDDERLEAGERLAELARSLGAARVEAIVQDVEAETAARVRPEDWRGVKPILS